MTEQTFEEYLAAEEAARQTRIRYAKPEIIAAVREYALAHYEDGGWDVIVEAYDDEQIADVIGQVQSLKAAIAKFAVVIDVYSDRQADARNSAF